MGTGFLLESLENSLHLAYLVKDEKRERHGH